jgi:hypothetical protein
VNPLILVVKIVKSCLSDTGFHQKSNLLRRILSSRKKNEKMELLMRQTIKEEKANTERFTDLAKLNMLIWWFDLRLKPIYTIALAASKHDARFDLKVVKID